jgi:hypothetical protein
MYDMAATSRLNNMASPNGNSILEVSRSSHGSAFQMSEQTSLPEMPALLNWEEEG